MFLLFHKVDAFLQKGAKNNRKKKKLEKYLYFNKNIRKKIYIHKTDLINGKIWIVYINNKIIKMKYKPKCPKYSIFANNKRILIEKAFWFLRKCWILYNKGGNSR